MTSQPRHSYDAVLHSAEGGSQRTDGAAVCPSCKDTLLHPTGHVSTLNPTAEYAPDVSVVCTCECGSVVELRIGNYKGHLAMDVVLLGTAVEAKEAPPDPWDVLDPRNAAIRGQ